MCRRNYLNDNGVIIVKMKGLRKVVVPMSLRKKLRGVVQEQFGHLGFQKIRNLISSNYYWPVMTQVITNFIKHCNI